MWKRFMFVPKFRMVIHNGDLREKIRMVIHKNSTGSPQPIVG